jgi:EAL domain-containing protein (putative c-di-GMP-specific phosphodiesterase class I)/GGDEF domain-containing protein
MLRRIINVTFLLVLAAGVAGSFLIAYWGDSVQKVNRTFISEKLPLSQRIGELRGVIADQERILYEYYSLTASRESFQSQRILNGKRLADIVEALVKDSISLEQVVELRSRLAELEELSSALSDTLSSKVVNWDVARAILSRVKPKVRQIEGVLSAISSANQQAVDSLGVKSQRGISNMVYSVIGFSILIFGLALFVAYYIRVINRQAFFDPSTGLPNQYSFHDELKAAFKHRRTGAIMMIVADREQEIFASIGAVKTADWQIQIARRLETAIGGTDEVLYRFASNAFVLVCWSSDLSDSQRRSAQLLQDTQQPLKVDGHELLSTLSIGAAFIDSNFGIDAADSANDLVQRAASACNQVRRAGGNGFAVYDEAMGRTADNALHLATDLQHAVENGELLLHYQPKVDTASGRLLGMEALVRWMHPKRGMISPMEFVPVAEDTGLIVSIGRWVLREACRQNAEWQRAGLRPVRVAVNLSARQFRSGDLLEEIDAALSDMSLPASSLELEITESMVMDDPEGVINLLGKIRDRGIHLSLDDFGTGHSSLAYLRRFPIDCVKIDRAFIKDTPGNTDDVVIAKTIVAMAKSLGLSTVAEGVETAEQLELLKSMGCDQIQGYFFSRPLPAIDFLAFYKANL